MPFKEIKVQSYKVIYTCDECDGKMKHQGMVFDCYPPKYPHKCEKCGYETCLDNVYPIHISKETE